MDRFKQDNFQRIHAGKVFPKVEPMEQSVCEEVRKQVAVHLGGNPTQTGTELVREIVEEAVPIPGLDANSDDFQILRVLDGLGFRHTEHVFLNWGQFDELDRIGLRDLSEHFNDLWYPHSDDLEVIDLESGWILSVRHDGVVSVLRFLP